VIKFEGHEYTAIQEFDCRIISLLRVGGGSYFTVVPISPLSYREQYPTHAKVDINHHAKSVMIHITDDYGMLHTIEIGKEHESEIRSATEIAEKEGLYHAKANPITKPDSRGKEGRGVV